MESVVRGTYSDALDVTEKDIEKFIAAHTHVGAQLCSSGMKSYVWKRKDSGGYIVNLKDTWNKLMLAARVIVAVENPADVCVVSSRTYGHRAAHRFSQYTGATALTGMFTPGTFTNYITKVFIEPKLLVVTDPYTDHQSITEASYVNIPVIAFSDTDACLKNVDIAIPCNNKAKHSIGLMYYFLAREVLRLRKQIDRNAEWVIVDTFFYRDPEETILEEEKERVGEKEKNQGDHAALQEGTSSVLGSVTAHTPWNDHLPGNWAGAEAWSQDA